MADFIIVAILAVIVFFILRGRFGGNGKGACGGGCAGCSGCCGHSCHQEKNTRKKYRKNF